MKGYNILLRVKFHSRFWALLLNCYNLRNSGFIYFSDTQRQNENELYNLDSVNPGKKNQEAILRDKGKTYRRKLV